MQLTGLFSCRQRGCADEIDQSTDCGNVKLHIDVFLWSKVCETWFLEANELLNVLFVV